MRGTKSLLEKIQQKRQKAAPRLAEKAAASGVRVRLEHYLGLWHVFQCHAGLLHAADRALQSAADFLRQHS